MVKPQNNSYRCTICDKTWVVPSLARLCEKNHLESENE